MSGGRRFLALSVLAASSLTATVLMFLPTSAAADGSAADRYQVINATVNAATDHEIAGTTAFPNFTSGAIDNYYSLAHSQLDNSPFAEGTASPVDTGPLGQTAAASGNVQQPQYADARWPGDTGKATYGNQGGPYATATASSFDAVATCSEASTPSSGSSSSFRMVVPKGFAKRLRVALAAWKAKWLVPLHLKPPVKAPPVKTPPVTTPSVTTPVATVPSVTVPTVSVPTALKSSSPTRTLASASSTPKKKTKTTTTSTTTTSTTTSTTPAPSPSSPGNGAFESQTEAKLDPSSGALVTDGESSLGTVSLGSGQIVIDGIDVTVTVTNSGTPSDQIAVHVGGATIGGVPVTIDQDGVHVAGQSASLPFAQADSSLNAALKQAGVQLFTVAPEVTKAANEETVTATGVHVVFDQPIDQSGIPAQNVEHILGEVYVDSLASPGTPVGKLPNLGLSGSSSSSSGSSGGSGTASSASGSGGGVVGSTGVASTGTGYSSTGTAGSTGTTSPQAGSQSPVQTFLASFARKPLWLLFSYFVWQALVIGTGASLWYLRLGAEA